MGGTAGTGGTGGTYLLTWPSRRRRVFIWERRSGSSVAGVLLAAEEGTLTGVEGCCDIVGSSLSSCFFSFALAATEWALRLGNLSCMASLEERGLSAVAVGSWQLVMGKSVMGSR